VFANKSDVPGSLTVPEVSTLLRLPQYVQMWCDDWVDGECTGAVCCALSLSLSTPSSYPDVLRPLTSPSLFVVLQSTQWPAMERSA
jgi:hypothetical protein